MTENTDYNGIRCTTTRPWPRPGVLRPRPMPALAAGIHRGLPPPRHAEPPLAAEVTPPAPAPNVTAGDRGTKVEATAPAPANPWHRLETWLRRHFATPAPPHRPHRATSFLELP